jgi:hypothetical protein
MDILAEMKIKENQSMSPKPCRQFTPEQKAEAVRIVTQLNYLSLKVADLIQGCYSNC